MQLKAPLLLIYFFIESAFFFFYLFPADVKQFENIIILYGLQQFSLNELFTED